MGQREAPALAARQHGDRLLVLVPAGEEEAAEQRLRLRARETRRPLRRFEHRVPLVELHLLLGEIADVHGVADAHASVFGLAFPDESTQQRRLARTVRTDERDVLAALERERRVVQQLALADPDRDTVRLDDGAAASRRVDEAEAEAPRPARQERDLLRDLSLLL